MKFSYFKSWFNLEKPWHSFVWIFIGVFILMLVLWHFYFSKTFFEWSGVYTEAFGMLFDIIFLGILFTVFESFRLKHLEVKRYKEEIDDFRYWKKEEAALRLSGLLKRLNRLNVYDIDLRCCYLKDAVLHRIRIEEDVIAVNFFGAKLSGSKFKNVNLSYSTFQNALLTDADFENSDLENVDFSGASLKNANFRGCKNIDKAFFCSSKFIELSHFDNVINLDDLKKQRKEDSQFAKVEDFMFFIKDIEEAFGCGIREFKLDERDPDFVWITFTKEYFVNHSNIIQDINENDHYFEGKISLFVLKSMESIRKHL